MMSESRYITHHEVLISSQSLLGPRSIFWGIKDFTQRAAYLGAGLMLEPLRRWSPARRELDAASVGDPILGGISYLAEPARSEVRIQDYLTSRFHWQLVYALMEESRFSPHMIASMVAIEAKLASAHGDGSFPVRVYAPMPNRSPDALILHDLEKKIYAQSSAVLTQAVKRSADVTGLERRSQAIVSQISVDAKSHRVAGVELNLLMLEQLLGNDRRLLLQVIKDLLDEYSPIDSNLALVQAVTIQPSRVDLSGRNLLYGRLIGAVEAVSEQQFEGVIIYAPGGGSNPEAEIKDLKERFEI